MSKFDDRYQNPVFRGALFGLAVSAPIWVVGGILLYRWLTGR